jgi:hypothetical protein
VIEHKISEEHNLTHPTRRQRLPKRLRPTTADIDTQMVPLIKRLWQLGYTTLYCCQGNPEAEDWSGTAQAYIKFGSLIEATLFAALAGPLAWDDKTHRKRHDERPTGTERWRWDWRLEGDTVRFPARDVGRATASFQKRGHPLVALVRALGASAESLRSEQVECPECRMTRIGAFPKSADPHRPAPRTCPTCQNVILSQRKDARYCSRRCQLAARDRRRSGAANPGP